MVYVHRWAWEDANSPIPVSLVIDHLCRIHNCVRPSHLEPVTNSENLLRGNGWAAKNSRKTHCPKSHLLSGKNLRVTKAGTRRCRECDRVRERERYRTLHDMPVARQRGPYKEKTIAT